MAVAATTIDVAAVEAAAVSDAGISKPTATLSGMLIA
jgi:hypothetical protein